MTGSSAALTFEPLPVDDPQRRRPDISEALAILGWKPRVSLAEGLRSTIDHFRERVAAGPQRAAAE